MKRLIRILLIPVIFYFGQWEETDSKCGTIIDGIFYEEECFEPESITIPLIIPDDYIKKQDIYDYAEECYNDTLRLKKVGDEYIILYDNYGEMFTKRQLNQRGYFYQYRWIINIIIDENNPMEFEYIFVKEPTLKGFIEWLKEK